MTSETIYRTSLFTIADGNTAYEGYTDGRTWNGWAWPLFTEDVARQILNDNPMGGYFDPLHGIIAIAMEEDIPSDTFTRERNADLDIDLYDFQQHGWCWEETMRDSEGTLVWRGSEVEIPHLHINGRIHAFMAADHATPSRTMALVTSASNAVYPTSGDTIRSIEEED